VCGRSVWHIWEMAVNDALCCRHHPLEGLVISSGAAAEPGSNAAREDALDGAPEKVSTGFYRHAKLLESPQGDGLIIIGDETQDGGVT